MRTRIFLLLILLLGVALPVRGERIPQTDRTKGLIRELLVKIDSTDVYAARKEADLEAFRSRPPGDTFEEKFSWHYRLAEEYSSYIIDSALVCLERAAVLAKAAGCDSLFLSARIIQSTVLAESGFYTEAMETIAPVPRKGLSGRQLALYYNAVAQFYHNLYQDYNVPDAFEKVYRERYNVYRDSLLMVADTTSMLYLHNVERKEARAGNFEKARYYNDVRISLIGNRRSPAYATTLYDRFAIAYLYERRLTGEAVDDLLESAIIEVENSKQDIASLLRVESLLMSINEVKAAKKISDYYFSSLHRLGSRKRVVDGVEQTIKINDRNAQIIQKRNRELQIGVLFVSLLVALLVLAVFKISSSRHKILGLKENLERSDMISKSYIGVAFRLYSSYIKRLDMFRTKVHSSLRKGHVNQALELTSPSGEIASEERRELFHNFDRAFVDIFPDYIDVVNSCLKPQERIVPKRTEILNNELRILALIKLGLEDNAEIADMLHCSVKTVYNLRSILKARLAIPEEEFNSIISAL